jgi:hypothetical protein
MARLKDIGSNFLLGANLLLFGESNLGPSSGTPDQIKRASRTLRLRPRVQQGDLTRASAPAPCIPKAGSLISSGPRGPREDRSARSVVTAALSTIATKGSAFDSVDRIDA